MYLKMPWGDIPTIGMLYIAVTAVSIIDYSNYYGHGSDMHLTDEHRSDEIR
jgi:hypothetical protein